MTTELERKVDMCNLSDVIEEKTSTYQLAFDDDALKNMVYFCMQICDNKYRKISI